jgi:hypothetical protein
MNHDQQIGGLTSRVESLELLEQRIDDKLTELQNDLSDIRVTLATANGSWKTLLAIGGMLATISGAVGAMAHWFMSKSP